jgi:ABC-type transport system involved in multi-copper enzyme maturation permease subunit
MQAYLALLRLDLEQLTRSWLVRGWIVLLLAPAVFLVIVAANEDELASETLAAYVAAVLAPLSWIVVSILSASAVSGEATVIADSILSKSVTRSEYMWAKITARLGVFLGVYVVVTVPLAYLVARYASANDTEPAGLAGGLAMVAVLFAFLAALGIALSTMFRNVQLAVLGVLLAAVVSGVALQFLGLTWMSTTAVIDELPETFRGETAVADQVRVMVVFTALTAAAIASGVWYFRRKDL